MRQNLIPTRILNDVKEFLTDNNFCGYASVNVAIDCASPREIFEWYCEWNGICRWSDNLWDAVLQLEKGYHQPK